MFLIFLLAGIMTSKSFKFLQDYRAPDGNNKGKSGAYYIFYNSPDDLGFKAFGSYYLLFNQFIPFELVILIEMSKIYYTSFMEKDIELHNVEAGNSFKVQNLSMHEEMGQIQYLFCDKTGTLTKNMLVFREMSIQEG